MEWEGKGSHQEGWESGLKSLLQNQLDENRCWNRGKLLPLGPQQFVRAISPIKGDLVVGKRRLQP